MLSVSEKTKEMYASEHMPKYLTISFPNGGVPAITNEDVLEESMKLTQSICEENVPQVGGCNSSQFEITIIDNTSNLDGKDIVVTLSCKDPDYKKDFNFLKEYKEGDIIKWDGIFYRFVQDFGKILDVKTFETVEEGSYKSMKSGILDKHGICNIFIQVSGVDWSTCNLKVRLFNELSPAELSVDSSGLLQCSNTEGALDEGFLSYLYGADVDKDGLLQVSTEEPFVTEYKGNVNQDIESGYKYLEIIFYDSSSDKSNIQKALNSMQLALHEDFDLSKEVLYGYIDTSDVDDITIFRGRVKTSKKQKDKQFKDIIAYDKLNEWSEKDITEWFNSDSTGIVDKNYKGEWQRGTPYTKGQTVVFTYYPGGDTAPIVNYFQCVKNIGTDASMTAYPSDGSQYWTLLKSAPQKSIRVKDLRNKLFSYLGMTQESVSLPLDEQLLTIKPFSGKLLSAGELITAICNLNACFGQINPSNGKFKYIMPKPPANDSNYKGEWKKATSYTAGNVVSVNNEDTSYRNKYYSRTSTAFPSTGAVGPTEDENGTYWSKKPTLYHPNGTINVSELYNKDDVEYQDYAYKTTGIKLIDDSGNTLAGSVKDTDVDINYSFLISFNTIATSYYTLLQHTLTDFSIEFTPMSISYEGLPFVECGDYIAVDVDETVNGEIVTKTVKTLVLCRTLSGINALTDEIEARYE